MRNIKQGDLMEVLMKSIFGVNCAALAYAMVLIATNIFS